MDCLEVDQLLWKAVWFYMLVLVDFDLLAYCACFDIGLASTHLSRDIYLVPS